jgi:hypothetical protein
VVRVWKSWLDLGVENRRQKFILPYAKSANQRPKNSRIPTRTAFIGRGELSHPGDILHVRPATNLPHSSRQTRSGFPVSLFVESLVTRFVLPLEVQPYLAKTCRQPEKLQRYRWYIDASESSPSVDSHHRIVAAVTHRLLRYHPPASASEKFPSNFGANFLVALR